MGLYLSEKFSLLVTSDAVVRLPVQIVKQKKSRPGLMVVLTVAQVIKIPAVPFAGISFLVGSGFSK